MGNNYGSNPAVIVQPAWPPHVVTTTANGQNNQRSNGEIQYEIIEAHEVKTPTNLTRVVTMQPTTLHNGAFSQFFVWQTKKLKSCTEFELKPSLICTKHSSQLKTFSATLALHVHADVLTKFRFSTNVTQI